MQLVNRGTPETRLKTLRFGLLAINAAFITFLIMGGVLIWFGVGDVKDANGVDYTMGDYIGDIGMWLLVPIIIVLVISIVIYFVYSMVLNRGESS